MTTYDLRTQHITLEELFQHASSESIRVITKDGQTLVIEAADEFAREVALLSQSKPFMDFLAQRSREKEGSISLDELDRDIEQSIASEAEQQRPTKHDP